MTSDEIKARIEKAESAGSSEAERWLREIALQLAISNEISQRLDEAILSDPPKMPYTLAERFEGERDAAGKRDPNPPQPNPYSDPVRLADHIVTILDQYFHGEPFNRIDALRIMDVELKRAGSKAQQRPQPPIDHGENLNPHLTRVDSADITCPNCCRPFWVHVSMVGPWNPPAATTDDLTRIQDELRAQELKRRTDKEQS